MKTFPILLTALLSCPTATSNTAVQTGLDILRADSYQQLSNRKVMVLTNPTGITPELDLGVDVMFQSGQVDLVGVMGPEHGFRGTAQAGGSEGTFIDPITGLTVYVCMLQRPCATMMLTRQDAYNVNTSTLVEYIRDSNADTVVFDIQDVGARFYTCGSSITRASGVANDQIPGPCTTQWSLPP